MSPYGHHAEPCCHIAKLFFDGVEQQLLHVLLYHASKTYTEMDKERNRKLVMRTVGI